MENSREKTELKCPTVTKNSQLFGEKKYPQKQITLYEKLKFVPDSNLF